MKFEVQRFADDDPQTYTTQQTYTTASPTYTTSTQTQTTVTPTPSTETTDTPTVIVISDKTLVDKEHAEYYVRKTINFAKKHFLSLDGLKIVTNKEIDDFFDELEAEEAAAESEEENSNG